MLNRLDKLIDVKDVDQLATANTEEKEILKSQPEIGLFLQWQKKGKN